MQSDFLLLHIPLLQNWTSAIHRSHCANFITWFIIFHSSREIFFCPILSLVGVSVYVCVCLTCLYLWAPYSSRRISPERFSALLLLSVTVTSLWSAPLPLPPPPLSSHTLKILSCNLPFRTTTYSRDAQCNFSQCNTQNVRVFFRLEFEGVKFNCWIN